MYVHEKKRPKEIKFQCTICDYIATCDWNLNHHIKIVHHKIKEHCCDKCGRRFSSTQYLKKHDFKNHGGVGGGRIWYKCDLCIGGKAFRGPGILEKHLRLIHKMEGPVNIKPEGFDEKMAKHAKKFWRQWKSFKTSPEDEDIGENLEKQFALNPSSLEDQKVALSLGSYESSVTQTNTNGKPILGELNFIPMRNSKDDNDQIKENYIGTSDYAIYVGNMNTDESTVDEYDNENQYSENEDFDNSNNTETDVLHTSKIKHEETDINDDKNEDSKTDVKDEDELEKSHSDSRSSEHEHDQLAELHEPEIQEISHVPNDEAIDILQAEPLKMSSPVMDKVDVSEKPISRSNSEITSSDKEEEQKIAEALENLYENVVPTHKNKQSSSSSSSDDEKNDEQPLEIIFNEPKLAAPVLEKMDIGPQLQKVKVELEEPNEVEQLNTDETADQQEWDQKFKMETNGIEIKIEENEVIKNRFGQVVDKKIKCNYCDKICLGKWAAKSMRLHCRLVHKAPKLREAKNEVTKEHLENDDPNVQKCKLCDKAYIGQYALSSMKMHMKSHSGLHHKCHICDKDFRHKLGSLVWHLQIKHQCENVCDKCK